jgi:hypothetical protein
VARAQFQLTPGECIGFRPTLRFAPKSCLRICPPGAKAGRQGFDQSRSRSLMPVLLRVCASTVLTITAQ